MSVKALLFSVLIFEILVIGLSVTGGLYLGQPAKAFEEGEPVTWISTLQLLVISGLSYRIFKIEAGVRSPGSWRSPSALWGMIAVGFLFLAVDEAAQIHESFDKAIHWAFDIEETRFTDRIDDVLVGLYGLVGMGVLYRYRNELKRYRPSLPFMICGFVLLFLMVALDVLTSRDDVVSALVSERHLVRVVRTWLLVAEDSFKLLAEGFFLIAFYLDLRISRETCSDSA